MAEVVVYGSAGEQVLCSLLADTSDITWSTTWGPGRPGGSWEASWKMDLRPDVAHPSLTPGNPVEVWDGPSCVFCGRLTDPDRGAPWELHAVGLPYLGSNFLALGPPDIDPVVGATFTTVPDDAIDQAILRGLPWRRLSSVSADPLATETSSDMTRVDGLLNAYGHTAHLRWGVHNNGVVYTGTDPTTPTWLLAPGIGALGTTTQTQVTDLYAKYVYAVDGTPPEPSEFAHVVSSGPGVRREDYLDITDLGLVSPTRAQEVTDAVRADLTSFGLTGGLTVTADELLHISGNQARLPQVKAGQMVRILAVVDTTGNYRPGMTLDVVIGDTRHVDGSGVIDLNPVGKVARTHVEVMAAMRPEQKPRTLGAA